MKETEGKFWLIFFLSDIRPLCGVTLSVRVSGRRRCALASTAHDSRPALPE